MKKYIVVTIIVSMLLIVLGACGSSESGDSGNGGLLKPKDTLDGFWTNGNMTTVVIEGNKGVLVWGGTPYKCTVDTSEKTITAKEYSWNNSDTPYAYEFVNGELKLTTSNDQALGDSTLVLSKDEEALQLESKNSIGGKWTNQNMTELSIDGESGFLTWGGTDYSCSVQPDENKLTVKEYSWDNSDVVYSYDFVYGRAVLYTENDQALSDSTILLIPSDVAEKLDNEEAEAEKAEQEKASEKKNSKSPSIEGANELSEDYYVIGEDIEPGIYDFGPTIDEDGEGYFSIDIYESKKYYDQAEGNAEGDDYIDHYKSVYGEEVKKGISLKKGNVLDVDYHGVLYKKQ